MKRIFLFCVILLGVISVYAQDDKSADFTGNYQVEYYPARKLKIYRDGENLMIEIVGQGKTIKFKLNLKLPAAEWNKISQDSAVSGGADSLQIYQGRYALKGNP